MQSEQRALRCAGLPGAWPDTCWLDKLWALMQGEATLAASMGAMMHARVAPLEATSRARTAPGQATSKTMGAQTPQVTGGRQPPGW